MTEEVSGQSLADAIGATPMVTLGRFSAEIEQTVYVKLELLNPGGSHKTRIALNMILAAEEEGILERGSGQTIIESTGGNTGTGLAIVAAVLGYRLVLVIPDNYSPAKQRLLRSYGAEVILADHRLGGNAHAERTLELLFENPGWVLLNQQANPANPRIHEQTTAAEIIDDLGGAAPEAMVAGVGTGGHLTGVGRTLRERRPDMKIVAVVPEGCSLKKDRFVVHHIQGLAVGLVPAVLDPDLIDVEIEVGYDESVEMMRYLMRTEGLGVGISSAANMVATQVYAARLQKGSRMLTFAYDSVHDYLDALDA